MDNYYIHLHAKLDGELIRAVTGSYNNDTAASMLKAIKIVDDMFKKLGIPQPDVR
jgi:hypothetical protein